MQTTRSIQFNRLCPGHDFPFRSVFTTCAPARLCDVDICKWKTCFGPLRYLSSSKEPFVTSSGPFRVTTREPGTGSCRCIHRPSVHIWYHTCHVSRNYLFFFRCSMNQSESARVITSQPGYGLSPAYLTCIGHFRVCAFGCLHVQAARLLFFMSCCSRCCRACCCSLHTRHVMCFAPAKYL